MNNMNDLLEKYFDGATSTEEEAQLKNYFLQENLPEDMMQYRPVFACLQLQQAEKLPDQSFEQRFLSRVGKKHHSIVHRVAVWSSAAAACIAIAMGSIYYVERQSNYMIVNGTRINDPEKALMVAAEKLHLVTGSFNNSVSHVQQIGRISKHLSFMSVFSHNNASLPDSLQTKANDEHEN
jgi:hypothetical protein